jgi:hypothetical protein
MSDQEISATFENGSEERTLFDELAGLVPEERQAEYYTVIARTRTLSPNEEMLGILEAMGVLALLTRETPAVRLQTPTAAMLAALRRLMSSNLSENFSVPESPCERRCQGEASGGNISDFVGLLRLAGHVASRHPMERDRRVDQFPERWRIHPFRPYRKAKQGG